MQITGHLNHVNDIHYEIQFVVFCLVNQKRHESNKRREKKTIEIFQSEKQQIKIHTQGF